MSDVGWKVGWKRYPLLFKEGVFGSERKELFCPLGYVTITLVGPTGKALGVSQWGREEVQKWTE